MPTFYVNGSDPALQEAPIYVNVRACWGGSASWMR
jgi:hypothetical protein